MEIGVPSEVLRGTNPTINSDVTCLQSKLDGGGVFLSPTDFPDKVLRKQSPYSYPLGMNLKSIGDYAETHYKWLRDNTSLHIPDFTFYIQEEEVNKTQHEIKRGMIYGVVDKILGQPLKLAGSFSGFVKIHDKDIANTVGAYRNYRDWIIETDQPYLLFDAPYVEQHMLGHVALKSPREGDYNPYVDYVSLVDLGPDLLSTAGRVNRFAQTIDLLESELTRLRNN